MNACFDGWTDGQVFALVCAIGTSLIVGYLVGLYKMETRNDR